MILVTGGTGLVGIHLLMELCQQTAVKIVAIYRSEATLIHARNIFEKHHAFKNNSTSIWKQIRWLKADITDIPSLVSVFTSYSISNIYHCAACVSFQTSAFDQLKKVNIEGTSNLINLSIEFGVQKFCYVSSIATLNLNPSQQIFDETSTWNSECKNSGYAISKYGGEMEVWRGSEEGLDVIIIQPGVIFGKGFTTGSSKIFDQINKGMLFYTSGSTGYVSAFDVAKAMIQLMKSGVKNDHFILVSENLSHQKIAQLIANAMRKNAPKIKLNPAVVNAFALCEEFLDTLVKRKPILGKDMVSGLFANHKYSAEKIKKTIPFSFEKISPVITTIANTFSQSTQ